MVQQPRYRPQANPGDYGISFQELSLTTSDRVSISGWLIRHPAPRGLLILLHGLGTSKADLLDLVQAFISNGSYHLLLIDFRAHGFSGGETLSFGKRETLDIEAALAFCEAEPDLKGLPVGCYGVSMGGAIGLLAAAQFPRIQAIAAESAYADLAKAIARVQRMTYHIPRVPLGQMVIWATQVRLRCRMESLSPFHVVQRISPRAAFFIHGLEDRSIPPEESRHLFERAGEPKELWLIPGAEHVACFYRDPALYTRRVLNFFDHALQGKTPIPARS